MSGAMKTMKVLVALNSLELGGTQINAIELAGAVKAYGVESILVAPRHTMPSDGPNVLSLARDLGLPIELLDLPGRTLGDARGLRAAAISEGVDLVHAYGTGTAPAAFWGPCRLGRIPLVMTVYEMWTDPRLYRSGALIVGTGYQRDELVGKRKNVSLVSPPVDLERESPTAVDPSEFVAGLRLDPGATTLVVVSRLVDTAPVKTRGIALAMEAVERLVDVPTQLVVVGTGPAEGRLSEQAERVNQRLGRRAVVMAGPLADPRPAYSAADVVIGMGGSAARGLAHGKLVVVTGENGWFKLFSPDTSAELFSQSFWSEEVQEDPAAELATTLLQFARGRLPRGELEAYSRRFAEENFGLDAMAKRLSEAYAASAGAITTAGWLRDLRREAGRTTETQRRRLMDRHARLSGLRARA